MESTTMTDYQPGTRTIQKSAAWSFWGPRRPGSKAVRSSPRTSGPTDEQLIADLKTENSDALNALFHRYALTVLDVARFVLGDAGEAQDVRQECFL